MNVWGISRAAFAAVMLAVLALPTWAATPEQSLNKCQNTVKVEGKKFIQNYVNAAATCLQKVSTDIVQNSLGAPSTSSAAACVTQYRKISDTRALGKSLVEKLQAKITAACTSPDFTLADVLGTGASVTEPLKAENIGAWCAGASLGGDGTINTVAEWVNCLTAAHTCAARSALASQYPRLLDWTQALSPVMSGLTPPAGDMTKVSDALAGLMADDTAIEGATNDNLPQLQCGSAAPAAQLLRTRQTTSYGPGSDGDLQKGVASSYADNGDGTITDNKIGLMWEKKDQAGGIHDFNNLYTWGMTTMPYTMNGTMVTTFLAALNAGGGFAGHTDWRIPNRFELESIVNLQNVNPSVDPAFNTGCVASCTVTSCSCTQSNYYWSATTYQGNPAGAWIVHSYDGSVASGGKTGGLYVRAVRGGS